jgi:2-keto-3-deoxy-L-rhamnonate aldolase RhmA
MADYLTAKEIRNYIAHGINSISVEAMPRLTDEARELLRNVNFKINLSAPSEKSEVMEATTASGSISPPKKTLKQKLKEDKALIGTFIQIGHPVVTEFVGKLGFDFLIIDSEHSAMHIETIQSMLQSLMATSTHGIVRIPTISYENITRSLDAGADALVIPQIRTLDDMDKIKNAAFYPPKGKRGIGPGRVTDYGLRMMDRKTNPDKDTVVIIQIETVEALHNLDQIISFDFFDMLFIGPGDLSMDLGVFGEFSNPVIIERISDIIRKTKQYKKKVGIFATNVQTAARYLKEGVDLIVINSELGMMAQAIKHDLTRLNTLTYS